MDNMSVLYEEVLSIFTINFMLLLLGVGLFIVLYDGKRLKEKGLERDYKVAKTIGGLYIVLGPILYGVSMILTRKQ